MRSYVILAVLKRNVMSYFSGLLGYLFIVVFVIAASFSAFNPQFFTNNLANLDQLTLAFPYLLLFIIPAVTMTAWADEKRQGTDELLFTLPAADIEILLGKFLSLVLVYTVALGFSLTQLGVLGYYADPDWGLLLTTYFGYWLAGSALISLGMLASALTSSVTVAFVLGAAFSVVPVFIGHLASTRPYIEEATFGDELRDGFSSLCLELSIAEHLREFSMGIVPLSGLVYFGSLIAFAVYLNAMIISRRHWVHDAQELPMGGHYAIRVVCLLVALVCGNSVVSTASEAMGLRFDMTAEDLYTLSDSTYEIIGDIEKENPVTIQAFLSPQVPRELVAHHARLKGLLRQYSQAGGSFLDVRFVEVTRHSTAAEEAALFDIFPTPTFTQEDGRPRQVEVFLGAVIKSSFGQVVIPNFETGVSIEYELTRSIKTVTQKSRLKIGILNTDAQVNGGFNMQTFQQRAPWRIITELKKQYKVETVTAGSIGEDIDVVIAVMPSALPEAQLKQFVEYVNSGQPVLILDDPMPGFDPRHSPSQPKMPQSNPMMGQAPPPEPRADISTLIDALDIAWETDELVWDDVNPHPRFVQIPKDIIFITPFSKNPEAISTTSDVTSGLQELVVMFSGLIRTRKGADLEFEPLLRTGPNAGTTQFIDHFPQGMRGRQNPPDEINRGRRLAEAEQDLQDLEVQLRFAGGNSTQVEKDIRIAKSKVELLKPAAHVVAAHIHGDKGDSTVNAIFVADSDLISDSLFSFAQNEVEGIRIDNVRFILNCVDVLSGDTSQVELRKRRPKHRALKVLQQQADAFRSEAQDERDKAEKEADKKVKELQEELDKEVERIQNDTEMDQMQQIQELFRAQQRKSEELAIEQKKIDQAKKKTLDQLEAREHRQIQELEDQMRTWAVILPPIPSILLGILILTMRLAAERSDIEESRRR
jgi:ABC-2 type transport system permease protein